MSLSRYDAQLLALEVRKNLAPSFVRAAQQLADYVLEALPESAPPAHGSPADEGERDQREEEAERGDSLYRLSEPAQGPVSQSSGPAPSGGIRGHSNPAKSPTIFPPLPDSENPVDIMIADWLDSHADGYEHGGQPEVAYALREKADGIRKREYLVP